ncbi:MAG: cysteine--tRNA ligase [Planctomycetota bacterium]|nr:cysteine--tRNA ligase [Planctomycetota bacterium]
MIRIVSTDRREKVPFTTVRPGRAVMYVCGPTVYDLCHLGNARAAVVFDTIRRYLEASGLAVVFISNVTDIDDKIINRAAALGISCQDLASRYLDEYERDMAALGVRAPTVRPKATEHIPEMIDLIAGLFAKGFAYTTGRGVWFDVAKFAAYGKLSGRTADDETTEHRVEQDPDKRQAQDFALWKFAKPGEPAWDSPWGKGRPGWHIECSAMGGKYGDFALDIHGGGADLAFPHHENEIAQSEAFSGKTFARYWLHNGFVTVAKEDTGEEVKMGKSKGNMFLTREALRAVSGAAIRLWILGTHYRAPLLYKPEFLRQAEAAVDRIYNCLEALAERAAAGALPRAEALAPFAPCLEAFGEAMDDDFNTPRALAAMHDFITRANANLGQTGAAEAAALLNQFCRFLHILGLPYERPGQRSAHSEDFIRLLVRLRDEARQARNYDLADRIRGSLKDLGVELNDRAGTTTWKIGTPAEKTLP